MSGNDDSYTCVTVERLMGGWLDGENHRVTASRISGAGEGDEVKRVLQLKMGACGRRF